MSHIAEVELEVTDLEALRACCPVLGLEFRENQRTHRWYGSYVGDSPLPPGYEPRELGSCDHAVAVAGSPDAYELGVVRRKDGREGYALCWDSWQGGYGLEERIGKDAGRLKQEYAAQVALRTLRKKGYQARRVPDAEGNLRVTYRKPERSSPEIVLEAGRDGLVHVRVAGCPGPACKELTRELEERLGRTVRDVPTKEMRQQARARAKRQARQ